MTNRELNRDVKRLYKRCKKNLKSTQDWSVYDLEMEFLAKEYKRLFYADREMKVLSKQSVLMMLSLNNSYRFVPLHHFYPHNFNI